MSDDDDSIPPEDDQPDEGELNDLKDEANMVRLSPTPLSLSSLSFFVGYFFFSFFALSAD